MLLTVLRDVFIVNDETIFIAQINFKNDLPFSPYSRATVHIPWSPQYISVQNCLQIQCQ